MTTSLLANFGSIRFFRVKKTKKKAIGKTTQEPYRMQQYRYLYYRTV